MISSRRTSLVIDPPDGRLPSLTPEAQRSADAQTEIGRDELDAETLVYEYKITDPATWVSPWTAQVPMKKNPDLLYEYACHEGNDSMATILRGARLEEKAAEKAAR